MTVECQAVWRRKLSDEARIMLSAGFGEVVMPEKCDLKGKLQLYKPYGDRREDAAVSC